MGAIKDDHRTITGNRFTKAWIVKQDSVERNRAGQGQTVNDAVCVNRVCRDHANCRTLHPVANVTNDFIANFLADQFGVAEFFRPGSCDTRGIFVKDCNTNGNRSGDCATTNLIHADYESETFVPEFIFEAKAWVRF